MNDTMTHDPLDAEQVSDLFAPRRKAMIDSQLRTSGVNDPVVLARMGSVAREEFVPRDRSGAAYMDRAVPLADGGMLAAPLFYGHVLSEAQPVKGDRALVIENGSGYLAALVGPLVGSVETLSPADALSKKKGGDYTLVLVDGAIEHVPAALAKRLADGGRLVGGTVDAGGITSVSVGRKAGDGVAMRRVADLGIPRLATFDKPKSWSF